MQYLDGSRTNLLCSYLEALHERRLDDGGNHSTLLLSAYIKLNDTNRIYKFVDKLGDVKNFNFEKAIAVSSSGSSVGNAASSPNAADSEAKRLLEDRRQPRAAQQTRPNASGDRHRGSERVRGSAANDRAAAGGAGEAAAGSAANENCGRRRFQMCANLLKYSAILFEKVYDAIVEVLRATISADPSSVTHILPLLMGRTDCLETLFVDSNGIQATPTDARLATALLEYRLSKLTAHGNVGRARRRRRWR